MAAKKKAAKKTAKKAEQKAAKKAAPKAEQKAAKKAAPKAERSNCKVVTVKGPYGGRRYKRKLCWGVKMIEEHPGLVITSNSPLANR